VEELFLKIKKHRMSVNVFVPPVFVAFVQRDGTNTGQRSGDLALGFQLCLSETAAFGGVGTVEDPVRAFDEHVACHRRHDFEYQREAVQGSVVLEVEGFAMLGRVSGP